jgi:predicted RNA binding protein YcfA (HicA-like mRNA interferase family)
MAKRVFNWTFDDVVRVLKDNGFRLNHIEGSHHYYVGHVDDRMRQVCVAYHGKSVLKPRTFKGIIAQSGLPKKTWGL